MNLGGVTNNLAGITNLVPGLLGGGGQAMGSSAGLSSILGNNLGGITSILGGGGLLSDLLDINLTAPIGSTINSKQHGGECGPPVQCPPNPGCEPPPCPPPGGNHCSGLFPPKLPSVPSGWSCGPPAAPPASPPAGGGCDCEPAPPPGCGAGSGDGLLSPVTNTVNNFGGITNILGGGGGQGGSLLNDLLDLNLTAPVGSNVSNCQGGRTAPTDAGGHCGHGSAPAPMPGCGGGGGAGGANGIMQLLSKFLELAYQDDGNGNRSLDNNEVAALSMLLSALISGQSGGPVPLPGFADPSSMAMTGLAPSPSWLN